MTAREGISDRALAIAAKVETFVRETVAPYEADPRRDHHGAPTDELVMEMREPARAAGVLTPHTLADGTPHHQPAPPLLRVRPGHKHKLAAHGPGDTRRMIRKYEMSHKN